MTDLLVLDLVEKRLVTDQLVLTIGYDIENLSNPEIRKNIKVKLLLMDTEERCRNMPKERPI